MNTSIQSLMTFSELRELSRIPFVKYKEIEPILLKPFPAVTIEELFTISQTAIFDTSFLDLLFADLLKRYLSEHKFKENESTTNPAKS